jgi:hypothetical protein
MDAFVMVPSLKEKRETKDVIKKKIMEEVNLQRVIKFICDIATK